MARLLNSFGRMRTFVNNADYVLYRKSTAGAWSYTIPETRLYYIDAVGGGAGGWAVYLHRNNPHDAYLQLPFGGGGSGWSAFGPFFLEKGTVVSGVVGNGGAAKTSDIAATNYGTFTGNDGGTTTVIVDGATYSQQGGIAATITHTSSTAYGTWTRGKGSAGTTVNGNDGSSATTSGIGGASVLEGAGRGGDATIPIGGGLSATDGIAGLIRVRVA